MHNIDYKLIAILLAIALVFFLFILLRRYYKKVYTFRVHRHKNNPLLEPTDHTWKNACTFNPTAFMDESGCIHMLYRALGEDGISRFGYATSPDGSHFTDETLYPIFTLENQRRKEVVQDQTYNPALYPSGGSWSGAEDPRMVIIENTAYVTFNAFDGWDFIRVGLTTIPVEDLKQKKFTWSKPILISPEGKINKNWVLFPEKINGQYAILHSINPEIQIEYVDDFDELASGKREIISKYGSKKPRDSWDHYVRSAGPPPIKTDEGWLVLYHAVNQDFPHQYRLGAMLLDLENPGTVIARSKAPLLIPDMWYENDWKPGIIYACGALVKNGDLYIYYGGGDKYVCSAHTNLKQLLHWLKK